jgi:hypothetical protein
MDRSAEIDFDKLGPERGLPFCPRCHHEFWTDEGALYCPCEGSMVAAAEDFRAAVNEFGAAIERALRRALARIRIRLP